jgi:hypothetical protein
MDPDAPIIISVFALLCVTTISIVWIMRRPKIGAGGTSDSQLARLEDHLTRIEQAVDAIAVETERISEGQRFTTKVLAERVERVPNAIPPGDQRG